MDRRKLFGLGIAAAAAAALPKTEAKTPAKKGCAECKGRGIVDHLGRVRHTTTTVGDLDDVPMTIFPYTQIPCPVCRRKDL